MGFELGFEKNNFLGNGIRTPPPFTTLPIISCKFHTYLIVFPTKFTFLNLSHMIVWKQHLARKCYCHPPLLGLLLFSSLVPITTSLIRLPSSAIFNRTWFLSLPVIFALFHISFSMLYSEFFQLLLLLFLRCVRVLDFVVLAAQSGFKNHPAFKWLYWNEKNTANTPSSIIFSVQFPI